MPSESDIQNAIVECENNIAKNKLPYHEWHRDAERRVSQGEQQYRCGICLLWRWKQELCKIATVMERA